MPKTSTASASAGAAPALASSDAPARVSYRVLPKAAGLIYSGAYDPMTGQPFTFARGEVVEGADAAIAAELEDRGLVEVLGTP